jgi:hypothetical protein
MRCLSMASSPRLSGTEQPVLAGMGTGPVMTVTPIT